MILFHKKSIPRVIALFLCVGAGEASARNILFLYALEADWAEFRAAGATVRKVERAGEIKIYVARLGGHEIWAAQLGAGQSESAVVAATLLARFRAELIVSTGAVGAISDELPPGTKVVVDRIQGWQAGTEGPGGWREAERAALVITPPRDEEASATKIWPRVKSASAEVFVASETERARLRALTRAEVVDMNLYGVQKATVAHGLPALHLRVVSDLANESAGSDFGTFISAYDGKLGRDAAAVITALKEDPESPAAHPELKALRQSEP